MPSLKPRRQSPGHRGATTVSNRSKRVPPRTGRRRRRSWRTPERNIVDYNVNNTYCNQL